MSTQKKCANCPHTEGDHRPVVGHDIDTGSPSGPAYPCGVKDCKCNGFDPE